MPLLTPSRVAVLVLSLSLMSFLWTFGLPHQLATPTLPIINHDSPDYKQAGNKPTAPLIPPPDILSETLSAKAKGQLEATTAATERVQSKPTPVPVPDESTIPVVSGEDGTERPGEEEAKPGEGTEEKEKSKQSPTPVPTTLKTEVAPFSTSKNGTVALSTPSPSPVPVKFCKDVKGAPNVMVILKTSKAEISEKLPTHLQTLLSCVPNFTIFSDHSGEFEGHKVYDALDTVSKSAKASNDEFREYEKIQADKDYKPSTAETGKLDKWKILPMVYKTFKMRPHSKFYIFIEADTSLSWTNFLQWMDRLDYRIPYYSGAPTFLGSVKFAQRGSGILLSNGALRQYVNSYDERYTSEWEPRVAKECCGDSVLATALTEAHVEFYSAWPLLQGETPSTLDWTEKHWCAPIVSWHHMTMQEIDTLWHFQRNWTAKYGWEVPYLIKHAYEEFVVPHLADIKEDWDNMSQDSKIVAPQGSKEAKAKAKAEAEEKEQAKLKENTESGPNELDPAKHPDRPKPPPPSQVSPGGNAKRETIDFDKIADTIKDAADSPESCKSVCQKAEDCVQWKFTDKGDGECHLGKVVRLGRRVEKKGQPRWTSGWVLDRIKKQQDEWGACEKPKWRFNQ